MTAEDAGGRGGAGTPLVSEPNGVAQHDPGRGRTSRVLLVEDEPAIVTLVTAALERDGYEVTSRANGRDALELCAVPEERIDLLITDVVVPGVGGGDLVGATRAQRPELPVLLISGYAGSRLEDVELRRGHTEFLAKPFRLAELLAVVSRLVGGGR